MGKRLPVIQNHPSFALNIKHKVKNDQNDQHGCVPGDINNPSLNLKQREDEMSHMQAEGVHFIHITTSRTIHVFDLRSGRGNYGDCHMICRYADKIYL